MANRRSSRHQVARRRMCDPQCRIFADRAFKAFEQGSDKVATYNANRYWRKTWHWHAAPNIWRNSAGRKLTPCR